MRSQAPAPPQTLPVGLEVDQNGSVSVIHTAGANGLLARRSTTAGAVGRDYVFDPSGTAQTFVKSDGTSGGVYVGSDGFGGVSASAGGSDSYLGFGAQWGYYTDAETGLALCGHRFYDSGTARWLNRDPIGYSGRHQPLRLLRQQRRHQSRSKWKARFGGLGSFPSSSCPGRGCDWGNCRRRRR